MPRILIVDDDPSIRELLVRIVEAEGLEPVEAQDGATALKIVKEQSPDVVLLDDVMPKMDGIDFLKALKSDTTIKPPPVIMLAEKGTPDARNAAIKLGVVDYILKPWTKGEIELRLKWALKAGATVPAVPWELSGAESGAQEARLDLQGDGKTADGGSSESDQWSSLSLPEGSGTEVVTPDEGGWLETKDGRVRVTLPAGAVKRAMALSASPANTDSPPNAASMRVRLGDQATDLTFSDRTGSPIKGVRLDRPVEITLELDSEEAATGGVPQVQEFDGETGEWIDLPTRVDLKKGVAKVRKLEFPPPERQRKDATILVISDSETEQQGLCESLGSAGYETLVESNPDNVTRTLVDQRPEVVILDIAMRRLNGMNILRRIKGDPRTRQVVVITLGQPVTADEQDIARSDYAQSIALGARDMISKPWHPGDLQTRVARAVDSSHARRAQAERAVARARTRAGEKRLGAARVKRQQRLSVPGR